MVSRHRPARQGTFKRKLEHLFHARTTHTGHETERRHRLPLATQNDTTSSTILSYSTSASSARLRAASGPPVRSRHAPTSADPNTIPTPPLTPPPAYSIIDPHDRLVVRHPSPANMPSPTTLYSSATTPLSQAPRFARPLHHHNPWRPESNQLQRRSTSCLRQPNVPILGGSCGRASRASHVASSNRLQHNKTVHRWPGSIAALNTQRFPGRADLGLAAQKKCTGCGEWLQAYEFPASTPTSQCQHSIETCSYCMHNSIRAAIESGGLHRVSCPVCAKRLIPSDVRRGVLLWMEMV